MIAHYGNTQVLICEDAVRPGQQAATDVSARMRALLSEQDEIRMVFAAGKCESRTKLS